MTRVHDWTQLATAIYVGMIIALMCEPLAASGATEEGDRESSVGMARRIEQIILPGTELEAIPVENRQQPIVLRVVAVFPHGTNYRYDLEYYGLDPGEYDLCDYLRRIDGTSKDDLPEIKITIRPLLSAGQVVPNELQPGRLPWLGGYRLMLVLGMILWFAVLGALLFWKRKGPSAIDNAAARELTVVDRLRQFAQEARDGRLTPDRHAELEHLLLAHWRKKIDVAHLSPGKAIAAMREHEEAGQLLRTLEQWLHAPNKPDRFDIDILLRPYQMSAHMEVSRP